MSENKHDVESEGSNPRDRDHPLKRVWRAHQDWRVWLAVLLMIALIMVYVLTDNLSLRPGQRPSEPVPAINGP